MIDTFLMCLMEFLFSYWSVLLYQAVLAVYIISLAVEKATDTPISDGWLDSLGAIKSVSRAFKADWLVLLWIIVLTALAEFAKYWFEETVSSLVSIIFLIAASLLSLRIYWQIVKQSLLCFSNFSSHQTGADIANTAPLKSFSKTLFPLFMVSMIIGTIETIGFVFMIIPAVLFNVYFALAEVLVCLQGKDILESLGESVAMTRKHFIPICNYYLPVLLVVSVYDPAEYWVPEYLLECLSNLAGNLSFWLIAPFAVRIYLKIKPEPDPDL
ncbi:MAG TPA: hypothetical protein PKD05_23420 [Candidatus Melainabacteria bacterium]|nr:hypothetical protein [Candidatus Melainabacteria bacterium]